ncbi:MAG: hypothetical protein HY909_16345 [Deltaproteobacteria bacterium]|nr:hypothetical protein [Deltaproteobacteria bacterium]
MEYEFSQAELAELRVTGNRAFLYGYASLVLGALGLLGALLGVVYLPRGGVTLGVMIAASTVPVFVVGFAYVQVSRAFYAALKTRHRDIALMMVAMDWIRVAFKVEAIAAIIAFPLAILLLAAPR